VAVHCTLRLQSPLSLSLSLCVHLVLDVAIYVLIYFPVVLCGTQRRRKREKEIHMRLLFAHQERDIELQRRIMHASAVSMPGLSPLRSPVIKDPAPFPLVYSVSPREQAHVLLRYVHCVLSACDPGSWAWCA
jgi:hypothetical protein